VELRLDSLILLYDVHRDNVTWSHLTVMSCTGCSEIKHRIHLIRVVLDGRPVPLILTLPLITLDNKFQKLLCICDEYVINLFVCIYEVRKGT
jgi:hypothetical protein